VEFDHFKMQAGLPSFFSIFTIGGFMAIKVKPVQATIIRDKSIARQIIAEVRRTPSAKQVAKLEKEAELVMGMVR